ncbi:MAG: TorF family putative porin [Rhodospirillales bacterium]
MTDNDPAVQGSLEYSYNTGFYNITPYIGFWGSNVDFDDGGNAHLELDTLFGFRGDLLDTGVSWDLGGIYYAYPGAGRLDGESSNYNYWEIPVKLTYSPVPIWLLWVRATTTHLISGRPATPTTSTASSR